MLELKMQVIKHYKNQVHMQKVGRQAIRPSRLKMIRLFRSKFVCLVAARKVLAEMRDQVLGQSATILARSWYWPAIATSCPCLSSRPTKINEPTTAARPVSSIQDLIIDWLIYRLPCCFSFCTAVQDNAKLADLIWRKKLIALVVKRR